MRGLHPLPRSRRRLLLVSQPLAEGVPQHVLDLVRHLDPERYELHVAAPRRSMLWTELGDDERVALHEIADARVPTPADLVRAPGFLRLVRDADVVHAHSSKAGFLARTAARLAGRSRSCVFTPHAWSFWASDGAAARAFLAFERRAARWCSKLVVVAAAERRAGLAAGVGREEQYRVVPNGVALERFAAEPRPVPGRVLMLGRLARQKRPDVAVTAFARARREAGHARLVIGGDGPDRDDVEAQIAAEGLGDSVELLGTHGDVPRLLAEAHCLLLSSDYEGCPYSVIEAMAAGVPVVATRAGGVPELVEDGRTGLLTDTGDAEGLARALAAVLADPERARRLGAAGREVARRRLSVERMAADVERVYDELAGDSRRAS